MGLINAYVTELTNKRNEDTFTVRIEHLQKEENEAYDKIIFDLCLYQVKIQEALIKLVQDSLEIPDEQIIVSSHETYQSRK